MWKLVTSIAAVGLVACSGDTAGPPPGGCTQNSDCDSGQLCLDTGACVELCTSDGECAPGEICERSLCEVGMRSDAPTIASVDGDSTNVCFTSPDVHCVTNGIIVAGANFDGASFALIDNSGMPVNGVAVRSGRTSTLVGLDLPDIAPGDYVLRVANGAGSVDQGLQMLKGDPGTNGMDGAAFSPTNDELVNMINLATNRINRARLPVGTGVTDVAAGEHGHGTAVALPRGACAGPQTGALAYDAADNLSVCDGTNWVSVRLPRRGGTTQADAAYSCRSILEDGLSTGDGRYWIDPTGGATADAFEVHCDMTSNGGGWTLVAYAGTITGNKAATAGSTNFFMLFYDFGTYDAMAPVSGAPFSRVDMFPHIFHDDSEFFAKRTSVPANHFIWPVSDASMWRVNRVLPDIGYMKLSNDGGATYYKRMYSLSVFNQLPMPTFTGHNWNRSSTENCDNCGASFGGGLNHRSLLYWETGDDTGGYTWDQWFHGQPLSLTNSTGPDNAVQDIEIYVRESRRRF